MIFEPQISRKPNYYPWTSQYIDAMWKGFWTPNEFSFTSDIQDFKTTLTPKEREIIIHTLSAISQIEIAVKKFWSRMGDVLPHPSLVDLGLVMAHVEVIHNRAYEKLLEVLHLQDVFQENLELDIIKGRVNYLNKYLEKKYKDDKKQYVYSLILFTLFVENVSLFSQFYVISWFNRYKNVLKDTAQQVQYTAKEEQIHAQVGIKIINTIRKEHPELFDEELKNKILSEAKDAFEAESKIIDWIIGDYSNGNIHAELLKNYVASRINDSLELIGFPGVLDTDPQLIEDAEWMDEEVLGNNMTDFFHKRSIDYQKNSHSFSEEELF